MSTPTLCHRADFVVVVFMLCGHQPCCAVGSCFSGQPCFVVYPHMLCVPPSLADGCTQQGQESLQRFGVGQCCLQVNAGELLWRTTDVSAVLLDESVPYTLPEAGMDSIGATIPPLAVSKFLVAVAAKGPYQSIPSEMVASKGRLMLELVELFSGKAVPTRVSAHESVSPACCLHCAKRGTNHSIMLELVDPCFWAELGPIADGLLYRAPLGARLCFAVSAAGAEPLQLFEEKSCGSWQSCAWEG